MKNLNLIRLLFLCFTLFSCQPKKEPKKPIIQNNIQNYKFDDDDPRNRNYRDSVEVKSTVETKKSEKITNKK